MAQMILTFTDFEGKWETQRRQEPLDIIGTMHYRKYDVPLEGLDTLLPAKGDAVTLEDVSGSGLLSPRVDSIVWGAYTKDKQARTITIKFIVPEAYSGTTSNYQEVKGSRITRTTRGSRTAVRYGITAIGGHADAPTEGSDFPGESGLLGLQCGSVQPDNTTRVPGLWFHVSEYAAMQAYGT